MMQIHSFEHQKYISIFRWISFLFIFIAHSRWGLSAPTVFKSSSFHLTNYIALATDCFFILSGFLLIKYFKNPPHFFRYLQKRFLHLIIPCFLFWICFQGMSFLNLIHVDLLKGWKDIFGLNVFGVPWYHNNMNYTWFCYALFWSNLLFISLFYYKKALYLILLPLIILSGYTVLSNFSHERLIVWQPYSYIPLSMGSYRAIFCVGLGFLAALIKEYTPHLKINYFILTFLEGLILFIFGFTIKFMEPIWIYLLGLISLCLLLFLLSKKNSLGYHITNRSLPDVFSKYLLGAYLFSSIAFLTMNLVTKTYPFLFFYGSYILLFSFLLSLFYGFICFKISEFIKTLILKKS